jgi:hypothetical protein
MTQYALWLGSAPEQHGKCYETDAAEGCTSRIYAGRHAATDGSIKSVFSLALLFMVLDQTRPCGENSWKCEE